MIVPATAVEFVVSSLRGDPKLMERGAALWRMSRCHWSGYETARSSG